MSSETASPALAARVPADPSGTDPVRSLAGLIGVLDRADTPAAHPRGRARRPVAFPADAYRRGAVRRVPLRPVPQAPAARPLPPGTARPAGPPVRSVPVESAPGRLSALVRRVGLWGAGEEGEYLAWPVRTARSGTAPRASRISRRPSRLHRLARRVALWGAGPDGEYLAWSSAWSPAPARAVPFTGTRAEADRPVVLRELPSTPTIKPATPSPVAALLPRGPASSAGPRGARPAPSGAVPVPGVRPSGRPERTGATGWPSPPRPSAGPARSTAAATGLVQARGDPLACPVRGSPPPARRARSPGFARSSFPPGPVLRSGTGAFRI
jgi:hypothetical protein